MAFEKFTSPGKSWRPVISLRRGGQIGLSQGALNRFALLDGCWVCLYFDKEKRLLGIESVSGRDVEGAVPLRVRSGGASIPGKAFCTYYGIEFDKTRSFLLSRDEDSGFLVADLENPLKKKGAKAQRE